MKVEGWDRPFPPPSQQRIIEPYSKVWLDGQVGWHTNIPPTPTKETLQPAVWLLQGDWDGRYTYPPPPRGHYNMKLFWGGVAGMAHIRTPPPHKGNITTWSMAFGGGNGGYTYPPPKRKKKETLQHTVWPDEGWLGWQKYVPPPPLKGTLQHGVGL